MPSSAAELDTATVSRVASSFLKYFGPNKIKPMSVGEKKPNHAFFASFPAYGSDRYGYLFPLPVFTQTNRANRCTNAGVVEGELVIVGKFLELFVIINLYNYKII